MIQGKEHALLELGLVLLAHGVQAVGKQIDLGTGEIEVTGELDGVRRAEIQS